MSIKSILRTKNPASIKDYLNWRYDQFINYFLTEENAKKRMELKFWKQRFKTCPEPKFKEMMTTGFNLTEEDYDNKFVLDVGCGLKGSLEWCLNASWCIGIDTLMGKYDKLTKGQERQAIYLEMDIERTPFAQNTFDIIISINSLDHINDLRMALIEIGRIIKPNGLFLVAVDLKHHKTVCEPTPFNLTSLQYIHPDFETNRIRIYLKTDGLHNAVLDKQPIPENSFDCDAVMVAVFQRKDKHGM